MNESIHLLYTNDFHSYFPQWPKVAHYVKKMRATKKQLGEACYLIDIGDHADRVHPITEATMGKANVELLNGLDYDVVTIGNNEGITLGRDDFYHLYDDAEFPVVVSNLMPLNMVEPDWLLKSHTIQTDSGLSIGFIGLTAAFNAFYHLLGWHVNEPLQVIEKLIAPIKETHDVVILLSHLGLDTDEIIARHFPEIDLIIGGHTHHLLKTGKLVNETLLTAAGKNCFYIGQITLVWNHMKNQLVRRTASTVDLSRQAEDRQTIAQLKRWENVAETKLDEVVTTISQSYPIDWFQETKPMQALTEAMRSWTDTDCAMLNGGILLDDLQEGPITKGDIHRICPHPINPCVVELTGQELLEVVRSARSSYMEQYPLVGFGFRGKVIGRFTFAGLTIGNMLTQEKDLYIQHLFINNEPLDATKIYRLATADTFTFGQLFPPIRTAKNKQYFVPEFLRDLLQSVLKSDIL